jgi:hypothetical protein
MNPDKYKDKITARIASEFAAYRKQHGKGGRYPKQLKELALRALTRGLKPSEIAAAAQVTSKSIYNWGRSAPKIAAPSELKLVSARAENVRPSPEPTRPVRIRIGRDVTIELLASELSSELLQRLSHLGVSL